MAAVTGPKAAQIFCEQRVVPRKPGLSSPIRTEGFIFLYYDEKEHSFMKEQLEKIRQEALGALDGVKDAGELDALRVRFLGKKGELTGVLKMMGKLSAEERPVMGQVANNVRAAIEEKIETVRTELKEKALDEAKDIFISMGFKILDGPEVELADYNFTKLNIAENHPSRDRSDTFYVTDDEEVLLRTQTSPMQIRAMEAIGQPPIRILAPGRVYRKDEVDATHSPMFHQIEGLVIDKGITMADLKGTLETLIKAMYGQDSVVRFRPHHSPFTEPSCEVDVQCFNCRGKGCPTCKGEGWIELLGAGMVHPKVLAGCGIDPEIYSGFAFGIGLERMAMRRFKISDMRMIFENDIRFLSQF